MVSDASLLRTEQAAKLAAAAVEHIRLYTLKTPNSLAAAGIGSARQYQHNLLMELGLRRIGPNASAGVVDRYPDWYTREFEFFHLFRIIHKGAMRQSQLARGVTSGNTGKLRLPMPPDSRRYE